MKAFQKICVLIFVLLLISPKAFGEDAHIVTIANYAVYSPIKKLEFIERWIVYSGERGARTHKSLFSLHGKELTEIDTVDELDTGWIKIVDNKSSHYFKVGFMLHPTELENNKSSFGYLQVRNKNDDTIIDARPMFYSVKERDTHREVIFEIHFAKENSKLVITRHYRDASTYSIPFFESQKIFEGVNTLKPNLVSEWNYTLIN